jgi:hypothetical protein
LSLIDGDQNLPRTASPISLSLHAEQPRIVSFLAHQLFVGAEFGDAAGFETTMRSAANLKNAF